MENIGTTENSAYIIGTIASPYYLDHTTEDGTCYKVFVSIRRLSGAEDTIPVIVPENCLTNTVDATGRQVTVKGTFQSRRRYEDGKRHLDLFAYADVFKFTDDTHAGMEAETGAEAETKEDAGSTSGEMDTIMDSTVDADINHLVLEGFITKDTMFRTTPKGKKITDFMVAVNSPDPRHPNYIPCIAWGDNAYRVDCMGQGDHIRLEGRVQSREYEKILHGEDGETTIHRRIAYEVSCSSIEVLETAEAVRERVQREKEERKNGNAA